METLTSYLHTYNPATGNYESKAGTKGGSSNIGASNKSAMFGNTRSNVFGSNVHDEKTPQERARTKNFFNMVKTMDII